ncbi:MAG: SAM-dependent methyltransferase [Bacteroidota bacterium]
MSEFTCPVHNPNKAMSGKLYLIPSPLSENSEYNVLPRHIFDLISSIRYYITENIRTTRRYFKKINPEINIDDITFFVFNKHTNKSEIDAFIKPVMEGNDAGLISEAGLPGVADPGQEIVALAHRLNIQVVPIVGPSSIMLALMASGLNGQTFAFNSYLPIEKNQRKNRIKELEKCSVKNNQSQIFMETPYRNHQLLQDILAACNPETRLCLASDITGKNEFIKTKTIKEWKHKPAPDIQKKPAIFIIYCK